jgi:hypothetical protein
MKSRPYLSINYQRSRFYNFFFRKGTFLSLCVLFLLDHHFMVLKQLFVISILDMRRMKIKAITKSEFKISCNQENKCANRVSLSWHDPNLTQFRILILCWYCVLVERANLIEANTSLE